MTFQPRQVEIHEFSRGFREVQINGEWVSGGFGNAIARSNYKSGLIDEIPEPIRNTVDYGNNHENLLGIPTAYNPPEGAVSLIAREIDDQYSILAVANKQDEDKGRTEIVGYRYFWLDKYSKINRRNPNMDGVGTLLQWWLLSNNDSLQYVFNMNPSSFRSERLVYHQYLIDSQANNSTVRNYPIYPVIFELQTRYLIELHELAVLEAKRLEIRLAWAWNVRRLEFPEMYLAIWYADEAAKKAIELDLQRIGVKEQPIAAITPSWGSQRRDNVALNIDEKNIEKLLLDFGFAPSIENARNIINLIPSKNVEWDNFFAKSNLYIQYLENDDNPPPEAVFYDAWEPVLAPKNIVVWLDWLREAQHQKHSKNFLKVHTTIEKIAQKDGKQSELSKLIHEGITALLSGLLDDSITYETCKWLLVDKKSSLWSRELNKYGDMLLNYLKSPSNTFTDDRPQTKNLWEDLRENYINRFDPQTPENIRQKISDLANLFRDKFQSEVNAITTSFNQTNQSQLSVSCLSALFYQYSEGSIPSNIFVPLKYDDRQLIFKLLNTKPVERMKWVRKTRDISLLVIALLIIIGGVGAGLVYLYHLANIYVIHPWQLSPKPSVMSTIKKCSSLESLVSEDEKSNQNKSVTDCRKELDKLLTDEQKKLKKLKDKPEVTPESDKISIRLGGTYKDIQNEFISNSLPTEENDKGVLAMLQYLSKKNINNDILADLRNCKKQKSIQQFESCLGRKQ
jgi:hypothetical protein